MLKFSVMSLCLCNVQGQGDGNPCSSKIDKPVLSDDVMEAMVKVMGLKKLLPTSGWPSNSISTEKGGPQPYGWVPYCESGEPLLLGTFDWGSPQTDPTTEKCTSSDGVTFEPKLGCCDKVNQPGPCVMTDTSADSYRWETCAKRWDYNTMGEFDTACKDSGGTTYLIS